MCRIAGIYNREVNAEQLKLWVTGMCQLQKHGGPDDEGIYQCGELPLVFGHRRLSIIDLSQNGHQPMMYGDGRYCITFNGEIYNYRELKAELQTLGCNFRTGSDTEVILAAFSKWHTGSFEKLNGMFAFSLLDNHTGEIFLVRDASGIKPLYYAKTSEGLAFASEVRAFKSVPYLQRKGSHWQVYLMAYGHLPEPVTTLHHVKPLPKGHYLQYNTRLNEYKVVKFLDFVYEEKVTDRKVALSLVSEVLEKAVNRHLIADAPIGVFLSGGLDSSIIALLANKDKSVKLNTVSIFFQESKYSERKYQDLLQEKLYCTNHPHLVTEKDFHTYLPSIIDSMDMPSCDGINTWFISKFARESGLKAVLSGVGGDELFGGYPSFSRMKPTLLLQQMPDLVLKSARIMNFRRFKRLQYLTIEGVTGRYLFLRGQFIPSEIAQQLNANESEIWDILRGAPYISPVENLSPQNQASWMESNLYMQNQLLRDADVMSMAHGLEIRVPFLDTEFIRLALQISSQAKYQGKYPKQMLIDSFKDELPEPIWKRPKMGFTFPFKEWLANDEFVKSNPGIYKKFLKNSIHWSQLMTLLLIEKL